MTDEEVYEDDDKYGNEWMNGWITSMTLHTCILFNGQAQVHHLVNSCKSRSLKSLMRKKWLNSIEKQVIKRFDPLRPKACSSTHFLSVTYLHKCRLHAPVLCCANRKSMSLRISYWASMHLVLCVHIRLFALSGMHAQVLAKVRKWSLDFWYDG